MISAASELDEYGSKLTKMCDEVAALPPGHKAIIFSAFSRLLVLAGDALASRGLGFATLLGSINGGPSKGGRSSRFSQK